MGNLYAERLFDFCFIQNRVGGACNLRCKLRAVARIDFTLRVTYGASNLYGKIIPRADALVREVVNALVALIHSALDNRVDGHCQISGVGRSAYLIEHYVYKLLLRR